MVVPSAMTCGSGVTQLVRTACLWRREQILAVSEHCSGLLLLPMQVDEVVHCERLQVELAIVIRGPVVELAQVRNVSSSGFASRRFAWTLDRKRRR